MLLGEVSQAADVTPVTQHYAIQLPHVDLVLWDESQPARTTHFGSMSQLCCLPGLVPHHTEQCERQVQLARVHGIMYAQKTFMPWDDFSPGAALCMPIEIVQR